MSRIKRITPSPALTIAIVALIAALGGSAVAEVATTSVSKKKTKKIAAKQADKLITQRESSLNVNSAQTAEQATNADTADAATNATTATNADNVTGRTPFNIKLDFGQTQTIATNGAVSLEANCVPGGVDDNARILAQTTQNGAVMDGEDSFTIGNFNVGTSADDRVLLVHGATAGTVSVRSDIDSGFVMAPNGKWLGVDGEEAALGVNYAGADCILAGVVQASG